ncbi:MAG: DAK2 domain-containing protein [Mycobacteriaceae bacterium]
MAKLSSDFVFFESVYGACRWRRLGWRYRLEHAAQWQSRSSSAGLNEREDRSALGEVLEVLDGPGFYTWMKACTAGLADRCTEINGLNVFPVADADTGTNMLFTLKGGLEFADRALNQSSERKECGEIAALLSEGAALWARGNSGAILSQFLRAFAVSVSGPTLTARGLAQALLAAEAFVTQALSAPVEGTVITVLRAAGQAAQAVVDGAASTLDLVAIKAATAAVQALEDTPSQLAELAKAGVVDAGGRGLVVLLDELVWVISGVKPIRREYSSAVSTLRLTEAEASSLGSQVLLKTDAGAGYTVPTQSTVLDLTIPVAPVSTSVEGAGHCANEPGEPDFEIMFLFCCDGTITEFREQLGHVGDSIVIVPVSEGWHSVHIHSSDAGLVIETAMAYGRLRQIRITSFAAERDRLMQKSAIPTRSGRAVLALVDGTAAAKLFSQEGAIVLRIGADPSSANVIPKKLLDTIVNCSAAQVIILPNGFIQAQELVAVAAAARDWGQEVIPLPSASMVQGLAALAVCDESRIDVDNAFAMAEAAAATRWGSVRIAQEKALTWGGSCQPGDGLGLVGQEVFVVADNVIKAITALVDLMLGTGGELVTVMVASVEYYAVTEQLDEHIRRQHPGVELTVYEGGQSGDVLQVGVE